MIELLGLKLTYETLAFFVLFAASEVIALSPLRSNSIVQIIQNFISGLRVVRREDDVVSAVRGTLQEGVEKLRDLEK